MLDDVAEIEQKLAAAPKELQAKLAALKDAADKAGIEAQRMQQDKAKDEEPEKEGAEVSAVSPTEALKRLAELNNAAEDAAKQAQEKGDEIKQLASQLDSVADAHDDLEKEINPEQPRLLQPPAKLPAEQQVADAGASAGPHAADEANAVVDGPSEDSKKPDAALASGEQAMPAGADARDAQPEEKAAGEEIAAPHSKKDDDATELPTDASADVKSQHAAQDAAGEQPHGDSQDEPKGADAVAEVKPNELFAAAPVDAEGKGSANAAEAAAASPADGEAAQPDDKVAASPDVARDLADAIEQDEAGKSDATVDAVAAANAPHALADGSKVDGQASPSKSADTDAAAAQPAAANDEEAKASENALTQPSAAAADVAINKEAESIE